MKLKVIACKVLTREIGAISARSPHTLDITYLRQGYHNTPDKLREILQDQIDRIDAGDDPYTGDTNTGDFDAILLGYGLCSNGVCGVRSKKYPIVLPRAHDCITLLLGSKEKYQSLFDAYSGGIYWYTAGWIENSIMPSEKQYDTTYQIYKDLYGEENADYLTDYEKSWTKNYKAAAYIDTKTAGNDAAKAFTKDCAEYFGWEMVPCDGDMSLLERFLSGQWDDREFLMVPPGACAQQSFDAGIVSVAK